MRTNDRARLEEALRLARQVARCLESLPRALDDDDDDALRLARAQALGLVDQLDEAVHGAPVPPRNESEQARRAS